MQESVPEGMHNRRHRHGRAWVPGVGLLYTVHRQRTDGIYAQPVESCLGCHLQTSPDDRDKVTRNQRRLACFQDRRLCCALDAQRIREICALQAPRKTNVPLLQIVRARVTDPYKCIQGTKKGTKKLADVNWQAC